MTLRLPEASSISPSTPRHSLRPVLHETNRFANEAARPHTVAKALADCLADVPPSLHEPARFHFLKLGKLLRGHLAYHSALAMGLGERKALAWATSVELLHNASLIHDDVCDRDLTRRGQESVLRRFGEAVALCLGDYLIAKAYAKASEADGQLPLLVSQTICSLAGGQAAEFHSVGYPGLRDYTRIAIHKTAPLLGLAVIGNLLVSHQQHQRTAVEHYFEQAALCFQIINDLGNFSGDDGANNPCSDLANCRPNAVIACFRDSLPATTRCLFELWAEKIRGGTLIADTVETRAWWHQIRESSAFADTTAMLTTSFAEAGRALCGLDDTLQQTLQPIQLWLQQHVARIDAAGCRPE